MVIKACNQEMLLLIEIQWGFSKLNISGSTQDYTCKRTYKRVCSVFEEKKIFGWMKARRYTNAGHFTCTRMTGRQKSEEC